METLLITWGDLFIASTILLTGGGIILKLSKLFEKQNNRLGVLERDHYGMSRASEDALRHALANPGHRVPDPRHPDRIISTEQSIRNAERPEKVQV